MRAHAIATVVVLTLLSAGDVSAAPAGAVAAPASSYMHPNRLAVIFDFGFGSASLDRVHQGLRDVFGVAEPPTSNLQINTEIGFRYYFPYHVLAELTCGAVYNWASKTYANGTFDNYNLTMEIPLLVGGYYTFFNRLNVYGLVGPTFSFFTRMWNDPGADPVADGKVGVHVGAGAEYLLSEYFAVGLELRYRYLKSGDLYFKDPVISSGGLIPAGTPLKDSSGQTYNIDLSGISLALVMRFFAM